MFPPQPPITIYEGRLEVKRDALIKFLDDELEHTDSFDQLYGAGHAPFPLMDINRHLQKHGEKAKSMVEIEAMINSVIGEPGPGRYYMHTFWHDDTHIMLAWTHLIGYAGFYVGTIELLRSKNAKYTDIVISNHWAAMRPYYEWVAKRLKLRFKERHKGGPKETPIDWKLQIVAGWKRVEGKQPKEVYVRSVGISMPTFRRWERELKEKGIL
jgi:hypothetical protein